MFYISYIGHPTQYSSEYQKCEGAYINAWVDEATIAEADRVASASIKNNKWNIETIDEWNEVNEETYKTNILGRKYFEQAKIDKLVFVYHTWGAQIK